MMQDLIEERDRLLVRVSELERLLNTPETENFLKGVKLESAHQIQRWGQAHDRCKSASDWFWLVGYLAGKALNADKAGDLEKTKHHCISTGAALANWHNSITDSDTVKDIKTGSDTESDIKTPSQEKE